MKLYLFIVQALLVASLANGQGQGDNWVMNDDILINFSDLTFSLNNTNTSYPFEGYSHAIYSDSASNIKLYSDGLNFFDQYGELITADSLPLGYDNYSNFQRIFLVEKNSEELFFIISRHNFTGNELLYSIYDLNENQFISIDNQLTSFYDGFRVTKSDLIRHGNGRDWWFVSWTTDTLISESDFGLPIIYISTLFSDNNVELTEIWESESFHSNSYLGVGELAFSNYGDIIVNVEAEMLHFYTFDRCTGEMNDYLSIYDLDSVTGYLAEFSPNDSKLYVTTRSSYIGIGHPYSPAAIIQYCLDCGVDIASTKDTIYRFENDKYDFYGMKLGPDGKIYLTAARLDLGEDDPLPDYQTHFWVINHPDSLGAACDLDTASISSGGRNLASSFPNIPNYRLGAWRGSPCDTIDDPNQVPEEKILPFKAYPNPLQDDLYIDNPLQSSCQAVVYNAMGQEVERFMVQPGGQKISTTNWPTGIYQLIVQQENENIWKQSMVKTE